MNPSIPMTVLELTGLSVHLRLENPSTLNIVPKTRQEIGFGCPIDPSGAVAGMVKP